MKTPSRSWLFQSMCQLYAVSTGVCSHSEMSVTRATRRPLIDWCVEDQLCRVFAAAQYRRRHLAALFCNESGTGFLREGQALYRNSPDYNRRWTRAARGRRMVVSQRLARKDEPMGLHDLLMWKNRTRWVLVSLSSNPLVRVRLHAPYLLVNGPSDTEHARDSPASSMVSSP